ncbi:alpha/beta hydrolase [bacterium SCSIO 12696]|nr:alpha/beta hydrolase [bacterium SCSIO 12696]
MIVADNCAILLHGLGRTRRSMVPVQKALTKAGYRVVNIGYPSRHFSIEELATRAIQAGLQQCPASATVHFVTHSMGGILVRQYLRYHPIANLGRVVMLASPNGGSEVVDKLSGLPGFKWANGEAGLQLATSDNSVPNTLGEVCCDLGVIAGTRSVNPILSTFLPSPNDGKVSVASTRVDGMTDHIQLPVTHTFMMRNKKVIEQVIHYLANGEFRRELVDE